MPNLKKLRNLIFPLHNEEIWHFLMLGSLMFFIILNNTLVRNLKDSFLVMSNGALSIPFIKMWGVLPATFLVLLLYLKLSNLLRQETLFYLFMGAFLLFFLTFAFVLLPYHEYFQLTHFGQLLRQWLPMHFNEPIGLIENWSYSCFYIVAELWGSIVVSLFFWQFANAVVLKDQATRMYPLFGQIADVGMILAGCLLVFFAKDNAGIQEHPEIWQTKVKYFAVFILISGICCGSVYYFANRMFGKIKDNDGQSHIQQKTKLSMMEGVRFLGTSPNLKYVSLMVFGFAIAGNLIEVVWKCQLSKACEGQAQFTEWMGYFSIFTGITTILLVFIGGYFLRKFGWIFGAIAPPIAILCIGCLFFGIAILDRHVIPISTFGYSSAFIITLIGSLQTILGKAIKFSLFDPTKEMTYIPLDIESRVKGKASIDLLGVRLGKSTASLFHQGIAIFVGSFEAALGIYFVFFILVMGTWIHSVRSLYEKYIRKYAF